MRLCLIGAVTGVCAAVLEVESYDEFPIADGYVLAPDDTGEMGWTWDGSRWRSPEEIWNDANLTGTPRASAPTIGQADDQVATTFFVGETVAAMLETYFVTSSYDEGDMDGAGSNFAFDLDEGDMDGVGSNFAFDVDEGTF